MSHSPGVREAQKERTRRALLDAALGLLEDKSLSSLGLREVAREAGVTPTAFYRHYASTADLGVALVLEALSSLRGAIRTIFAATGSGEERIDRAVTLIAAYVREHPAHVRFIARERYGGVEPVRRMIAYQLARFTSEVRAALAPHPESRGWSAPDLHMLAQLYVDYMVMTAAAFLDTTPEQERGTADRARRQMRLISVGRHHWLDAPPG